MTSSTDTPTTDTPTVHQHGYDPDWCGYLTSQAATELRKIGMPWLADHVEDLERWHARHNPQHLYGPEETS